MHVVFVCTGNICRSPFAERYARLVSERAGHHHRFSSVGVGAVVGAPMEELMAGHLAQLGGDSSSFAARQLDHATTQDADILLALESTHRRAVIAELPALHDKTFVLRTAARTASFAPPGVDRLEFVLAQRPRPVRGDSIADPYTRGPKAARRAAAQIVDAIDVLFA